MHWDQIYSAEVAPVLAQFSSGPPVWVYALIGLALAAGVAALVWLPGKLKPIGLVLLFVGGFILYMMYSSADRAQSRPAEFRTGVVERKFTLERPVRRTTGIMEPETSYWIELRVQESATFDARGAGAAQTGREVQTIGLSEALYGKIQEGTTITGVILPTATNHFHFLVNADGTIVR